MKGLSQEVTFEQRPPGSEEAMWVGTRERNIAAKSLRANRSEISEGRVVEIRTERSPGPGSGRPHWTL